MILKMKLKKMSVPVFLLVLGATLGLMAGCGGNDDPQVPMGLVLDRAADEVILGETVEVEASFLYSYSREEVPDCDWYVGDVLGGNAATGTISQDNPATYTAPVSDPGVAGVEITAVWRDDESITGVDSMGILIPIIVMHMDQDQLQVGESMEVSAELAVDRSLQDFDWYVDDILGGNAAVGIVSQDNPATYTAPQTLAGEGSVEIRARWRDNPDFFSSDLLTVRFTIKHVDKATGVDLAGGGAVTAPLQSIGYALAQAAEGDTVYVWPGEYGAPHGGSSSQIVDNGVTLRGADAATCIIDADPASYSNLITIHEGTTVEHFTLRNLEWAVESHPVHGIYCNSVATIRDIHIHEPFDFSAIRVSAGGDALVENCVLVNTLDPGTKRGFELVFDSHSTVRNCTVSGWYTGFQINATSDPLIENCTITGNKEGVIAYSDESNPDLGGGARGSQGGNIIQNNTNGLYNKSLLGIYAMYNTWSEDPPVEGPGTPCDYYSSNGGWVILESSKTR